MKPHKKNKGGIKMIKIQKEGIVKAIPEPKGEWKSFCLYDFLDDKGKTAWISTKKPLNFNKGNKIKFEYTEMINGEYTNRYLSGDAIILENKQANTSNQSKDDFRINVDASNIENRVIDLLNNCSDLNFKEKLTLLEQGTISEVLVGNFKKTLKFMGIKDKIDEPIKAENDEKLTEIIKPVLGEDKIETVKF